MYQNIILIGNVGNEPEMRYTPSGVAVTSFSLAVNKHWTDSGTNEKKEKTTWFRITTWRKTAEIASQYLKKGSKVMVAGEMEAPNAYLDKSGKPAASLEVTANEIKFLDSKPQDGNPQQAPAKRLAEQEEVIPF